MLSASEWHKKHHKREDGRNHAEADCFMCINAKAKCNNKRDFKTRALADREALRTNIERNWFPGECVKPYRCRYCRIWHLTTATRKVDTERVRKMRLRWMRKTHQKITDNDRGIEYPETG